VDSVVSMGALNVRLVGEVRSTQEELWVKRTWLQDGAGLAASSQRAGVGRSGRPWLSPEGGVYLSLLVGKGLAAADADVLGEAAALAVVRSARELVKHGDLFLKWPNDVVTWGRARSIGKLAGVIVRTEGSGETIDRAAVGIGINVRNPVEKAPLLTRGVSAVSLEGLAEGAGQPWATPRAKVLEYVVGWFGTLLQEARADPASVRAEFAREVAHAPMRARVAKVGEELKPLSVERGGALVVRRSSGKRATVSLANAERLVWRITPRRPSAKRPKARVTSPTGARRAGPPRSNRARSVRTSSRSKRR
jgi:BirA family biotin operon repressor/biotin-[acetyl-CoA-carboxylase] ligase